jgi:tetratricopeptide (TPR) repeat protein
MEAPVEDISSTSPETDSLPESKNIEPIVEPHSDANQSSGPAVVALLEDVKLYENSGASEQAVATIERALRIEPKNPLLWQRLSFLRLRQGHWRQAIAMAQKSNALAAGDNRLQLTNWKIIAQASEANGDKTGVKLAQQMIQSLSK